MKEAYDTFSKSINVLDTSKEGQDMWEAARKHYDTYTSKIEN